MNAADDQRLEMYRRMMRIRLFEEKALEQRSHIPGVIHVSIGMEASCVGACMAVRRDDYMVGTHRSHGHPIAKGARVDLLMAELMGKATGVNKGKGGSMHLADFSVGSLGETSIVGAGLPVATGAALGAKMLAQDRVALCFFGDGAAAQGTFHESLNLASLWNLPVVYLCENNAYGQQTPFAQTCSVPDIASRAASYAMHGQLVDGQDVLAVHEAVSAAVEQARAESRPSLIETRTYRFAAHAGGPDPEGTTYRSPAEVEDARTRDPIPLFRQRLITEGTATAEALTAIDDQERQLIEEALRFALESPFPDPEATFDHLYTNPISVRGREVPCHN